MTRAVFCPTRGDPFLISYWLRHFSHWRDAIDARLYLCVSGQPSDAVKEAIRTDPNLRDDDVVMFSTVWLDHGPALQTMSFVTEDIVVLEEDDMYVRDGQAVRALIEEVEGGYDVAAAACHNCSPELAVRGPGLNPRLLVARTRVLHNLRAHYGAYNWAAGETVAYLSHVCQEDCSSDTFYAAGLELRARARVLELPVESPSWFHVGCLSTPGPMSDGPQYAIRGAQAEGTAWCSRVSWWERFVRTWRGGLESELAAYSSVVAQLVEIVGREGVDAAHAHYASLITWQEK